MPDAIWNEQDGVAATVGDQHVATVELCRPPNNFFDVAMIRRIADLYDALAAERDVRVIVLCASGKHFCAGADFSGGSGARIVARMDRTASGAAVAMPRAIL